MSLVSTLNIGGMLSPLKQTSYLRYLQENSICIALVQETNQNVTTSLDVLKHSNCYKMFSSPGSQRGSGLLILISSSFYTSDLVFNEIYPGYAAALKFKSNSILYTIVNIYLPHNQLVAIDILTTTEHFLRNTITGHIIVGGDFNCVLDPGLDRTSGIETHNAMVTALTNFVSFFNLSDPFRFNFPTTLSYTRIVKNRTSFSASRIDRFYVSNNALNAVTNIEHHVCPFSDHHSVHLTLDTFFKTTAYWIFDGNLLKSERFNEYVHTFWEEWCQQKERFEDIGEWWDIGKIYLRGHIQCNFPKRRTGSGIFDRLNRLSKQLSSNPSLISDYLELKAKVSVITEKSSLEQLAQGKAQLLKHGNSPTKFFFRNLRRRNKVTEIDAIRNGDGRLYTGSSTNDLIRQHIAAQFQDPVINDTTDENFFRGIPTLSENNANSLEAEMTEDEILIAINELSRNTSPGLDGFTSEFYVHFRRLLAPELVEVYNRSFEVPNRLPTSWSKIAMKMIPKTGNLDEIKNWRPVSLCNVDYKIVMKALSNRLKQVLATIISVEQSFCIPTRCIHDNILVAKFLFNYSKVQNTPLGIIAIDQQAAFDRISHEYLFKVLKKFGFGEKFIQAMKNVYEHPLAIIKHHGSLLASIQLKTGIKQGCPLSGSLYVICFEVLLHNFRETLSTSAIDLSFTEQKLVSLAYADDLLLFATNDNSFTIIKQVLDRYEQLSNAKVNYEKTTGLWCGPWKTRIDRPLGIRWTNMNIKYLGLHIGEGAHELNNVAVENKLNSCINAFGATLIKLSLRTRSIVLNYLVASSIWHILKAHTPNEAFLKSMQRKLLHQFWLGRRWLPESTLYPSPEDGGLGIVSIDHKVKSFHLRTLQTVVYAKNTLISSVFYSIMKIYDQSFLLMETRPPYPQIWSPDICTLAETWSRYRKSFEIDIRQMHPQIFLKMPLLKNPAVKDKFTGCTWRPSISVSVYSTCGDVINAAGNFVIPNHTAEQKMLRTIVRELFQNVCHQTQYRTEDDLENFLTLDGRKFETQSTRELSNLVRVCLKTDEQQWQQKWGSFIGHSFPKIIPNLKNIYCYPSNFVESDIAVKLLYHALPHPNQLSHFNPVNARSCGYCGGDGSLYHRFWLCSVLNELKTTITNLCLLISPTFVLNNSSFIIGTRSRRLKDRVISMVLSQSKYNIHHFFRNKQYENSNSASSKLNNIFISGLKSKIRTAYLGLPHNEFIELFHPLAHIENVLVFKF